MIQCATKCVLNVALFCLFVVQTVTPAQFVIGNVGCVASGRVGPLQLSQLEMSVKEHRADSEQRMVRVDAQLNKAQLDLEHNHKLVTLHFTFC